MANTIGFDPAAWSIDGARHRADLLRAFAYAATNGSEGIVAPGDCKVHQLPTPGNQVVIDAGALLIRNRSSNTRNQTYVANARAESRMDITPTGASPRSDLVVVRVEDPQYSPWTAPSAQDAPDFQYTKPFIVQGVPASTVSTLGLLSYSAVALARIDIPANTSVITDAMVKELRQLAQPREHRDPHGTWMIDDVRLLHQGPTYADWSFGWAESVVPDWATHYWLSVLISGFGIATGGAVGAVRARVGTDIGPEQAYDFNLDGTNGVRDSLQLFSQGRIDNQRGQLITLKTQGFRDVNIAPGYIASRGGGQFFYDMTYFERAI